MTLPIGAVGTGAVVAAPAGAPAQTGLSRKDAEGFERLLVSQLSKSLVDGALDEQGAGGVYADRLPEALTQALMDGGGIGLASMLEGPR